MQIIQWYEKRWLIEQYFRTLKKQGLNVEDTRLKSGEAILRQTILALGPAVTVMKLVLAREEEAKEIEAESTFSTQQVKCLETLQSQYQGRTQKSQNPYPEKTLRWAAWVIARLGGWKGYKTDSPPGPITMYRGLKKFHTLFEMYTLLNNETFP